MPLKLATRKMAPRSSDRALHGVINGYRSGLEEVVADQLRGAGIDPRYESIVVPYEKPVTKHRYTPDFPLTDAILIETKGRFVTADRQKHILIKKQHPHLDIRFVFSSSKVRISKTSKTTYAAWCEKYGFKYADKKIPLEWLEEVRKQHSKRPLSRDLKGKLRPLSQGKIKCFAN